MRASSGLNFIVFCFLIACSTLIYGQEPRQDENRAPRQQEPRQAEPRQPEARPEARPEPRRDQTNAPRQDEAKPPKENRQEQRREDQRSRDQMRSAPERGQGHQRPAGKSVRIPEDRFDSSLVEATPSPSARWGSPEASKALFTAAIPLSSSTLGLKIGLTTTATTWMILMAIITCTISCIPECGSRFSW